MSIAKPTGILSALTVLACVSAAKAQECTARVLLPVTDDLGDVWRPGKVLPVNIARESTTGELLCASGGSCIPRQVGGAPALKLLDCSVGREIAPGDHKLVADARLAGPAFARRLRSRDTTDQRLSALGFSNAAAGSLADDYVNRPSSAKAKLVAEVLAGSTEALARLRAYNP